jgi:hypothetical protein
MEFYNYTVWKDGILVFSLADNCIYFDKLTFAISDLKKTLHQFVRVFVTHSFQYAESYLWKCFLFTYNLFILSFVTNLISFLQNKLDKAVFEKY